MMNSQVHRNYMPQQSQKFFQQLAQPQGHQVDQSMNHVQNNIGNGSVGGHHHTYSSGGLGNPPYTSPQHTSNGTPVIQNSSHHWQEQQTHVLTSRGSSSPHHHARQAALLNKNSTQAQVTGGINPGLFQPPGGQTRKDGPSADEKECRKNDVGELDRQDWKSLDLGGQGLRALSNALFQYTFLDKLYINHNKLTSLPPVIGRLKLLQLLDASGNQLTDLPPELGMLTNLKNLYLFDNQLTSLPNELGSLYHLEFIGLEGNPMREDLKQIMIKDGPRGVITTLRESLQSSYSFTLVFGYWVFLTRDSSPAACRERLDNS